MKGYGEYIVLDVECNKSKEKGKEVFEIIQLSAVRVKSLNFGSKLEIADDFNKYIKIGKPISKEITNLTGITKETLQNAEDFKTVIQSFNKWMKRNTSTLFLVMWGARDKAFIDNNCIHSNTPKLNVDFLNLQTYIQHKDELDYLPSLESQVKKYLGDFKGDAHNSLNDAKNLASLFIKVMKELRES